eukprot:475121_1
MISLLLVFLFFNFQCTELNANLFNCKSISVDTRDFSFAGKYHLYNNISNYIIFATEDKRTYLIAESLGQQKTWIYNYSEKTSCYYNSPNTLTLGAGLWIKPRTRYSSTHNIMITLTCLDNFPPTNNPTANPTQGTYSPTEYPSNSPSLSPSNTPSFSPSNAPSSNPSFSPSTSPTQSPTACFDINIVSNDGADYIQNISFEMSEFVALDYTNITRQKYKNIGSKNVINCTGNNNICHIECMNEMSCAESKIITMNQDLSQIIIECTGNHSCYRLAVDIFDSFVDSINVICTGMESCAFMNIAINDILAELIIINCVNSYSCKSMEITFKNSNNYVSQLLIKCEKNNACSKSMINTNEINVENMTLICYNRHACNSATLDINATTFDSMLFVHCIGYQSCLSMNIALNMINKMKMICYTDYSCDNVLITAADNIPIHFIIHKYR